MTTPDPDPLVPIDYDEVWQDGHDTGVDDGWTAGFEAGVRIRPIVLAAALGITFVAGILLASNVHAAPRSAANAIPTAAPATRDLVAADSEPSPVASGNLSQPSGAPLVLSPVAPSSGGRGFPSGAPRSHGRTGVIAQAKGHGANYLAIPIGPGHRVRVCGPGGCLELVSTDAGPNHERLVAGRIADVALGHWRTICGLPDYRGTCHGSWSLVIGPTTTPPATDVEVQP